MAAQRNRIFASPRARRKAELLGISLQQVEGSGPAGRIIEADVLFYQSENEIAFSGGKPIGHQEKRGAAATPLAKKIAEVNNIDLDLVEGSGWKGKIMSADVLRAASAAVRDSLPNRSAPLRSPMSAMRKTIAERMVYSKQSAPHVTLTVKADVTKLVELRNRWIQEAAAVKPSYTDILVKVAAQSLRNHPHVNVSLDQGEIVYHQDCHIGVAVALDEGLIVPVIHDAEQKSLAKIAAELKEKVKRAKQGKVRPEDLQNGRFTISNLGMYEVDGFTPIINPPESAILGVGRIVEDLIVENGRIRIGKTMMLSLSFDHRVMDGAPAALFLKNIKDLLENPESLGMT
ncbi:2-oxo acid dehydrogenase subunit E2 [Brevibacillus marinus]|uniref:2-oxo acid dehydrogenase subunit E2 n=1 Tax=Brevibacillus marinus TaxID=2496837 RepID=UPI0013DF477F|nr:2-oxo acid dehydrogenase subunit E2 [Brevibacillus marinus]